MTVRTMVQPVSDTMQRQTLYQEPPVDPQPEQRQRDKEGAPENLSENTELAVRGERETDIDGTDQCEQIGGGSSCPIRGQ